MACCSTEALSDATSSCHSCSIRGVRVDRLTVKALLTESALQRLDKGEYFFCSSPDCQTVYFADEGQMFTAADIRVAVWQKEPFGGRMICYCFGENERDIAREGETCGRSEAVQRVRHHIAEGRCACEVRNPRGNCCLGDVAAAVRRIEGR